MPAGRPTELSDELCLKIRALVLQGKNLLEIATECEIAYKTMEGWKTRNYEGFADKLIQYKNEWRLLKSEENIDEILAMGVDQALVDKLAGPVRDAQGEVVKYRDPKLLKIKADISTFVAETLGKSTYSKRTEQTGAGGGPIQTQSVELTEEQKKRIAQEILYASSGTTSNPREQGTTDPVLPNDGQGIRGELAPSIDSAGVGESGAGEDQAADNPNAAPAREVDAGVGALPSVVPGEAPG